MITILDLKGELAKLNMLHGRRPEMTEAEHKASGGFATLSPFRDGNIFSAKFTGDGAWERHPNGEELVQVVDGSTTLHIITEAHHHRRRPEILRAQRRHDGHRAARSLAPLPLVGRGEPHNSDPDSDPTSCLPFPQRLESEASEKLADASPPGGQSRCG